MFDGRVKRGTTCEGTFEILIGEGVLSVCLNSWPDSRVRGCMVVSREAVPWARGVR